jgi:putative transposase
VNRWLPIAPLTYRAHFTRWVDAIQLPSGTRHDAVFRDEIGRLWEENFRVCGVRKVWVQLCREGMYVTRCTVEHLMHERGLQGIVRGKRVKTTVSVGGALSVRPGSTSMCSATSTSRSMLNR